MKINFLGTGSAHCLKNFQTNILIEKNDKRLLFDAGSDAKWSLNEVGLSYLDIDAIYITHLHADHVGGIEDIAFCSYFDKRCQEKISLIGNNELIRDLWNNVLRGGLKSIQGKNTTLHDFFDVEMIKKNHHFFWEDIEFRIVQSIHIIDEYAIVPSYGVMACDPEDKQKVYFTGDTQHCPNQILDFYKQADLIIQDCETSPFASGVHAHYRELSTLPAEVKRKMLLVHYQDNVVDGFDEWTNKATQDGFLRCPNFIPKGYALDTSDKDTLIPKE
jgi:ribonuclease BN (tRNA processing enzyme)